MAKKKRDFSQVALDIVERLTGGKPTGGELPAEPRHEAAGVAESPTSRDSGMPFPPGAEGQVQFAVNLHVKMSDFAGWEPARIASFFNGIAMVLAAKGKEN